MKKEHDEYQRVFVPVDGGKPRIADGVLGSLKGRLLRRLPDRSLGLVLHFVKRERERARAAKGTDGLEWGCGATPGGSGCCSESHGMSSTPVGHFLGVLQAREQQCRSEAWSQVEQIAQAMAEDPLVARLIVGFDACGSEAATEMGTYAAHLRCLRRLGRPVPEALSAANPAPESWYRSARTYLTCHAGEDFDHLLGGLRHIDEALEFYDLAQGDRIGHGTALGLSPTAWMQRLGGTCWVRRGEWLDDLVWFHAWLAWCGEEVAVVHDVVGRIEELSHEVYGSAVSPAVLFKAWRLRSEDPGEPFPPESFGRSNSSALPDMHLSGGRLFARESLQQHVANLVTRESYEFWRRYHTDSWVQQRWDESLGVALEPEWATAIARVQSALTQKLVARRIAIEINPSSNLTIGPLERLVEHPVFRWLDPRKDLAGAKCPQIVVGTDDPSTFATELLHEYAFLARAAQELGATERQIEAWLEHLRQAGMSLSFLPTESFNGTGPQS